MAVVLATTVLLPACNQPPAVNPWRDDAIPDTTWSTPSQDGVLAAGHPPVIRHRGFPERSGPYVEHGVPHYPLWWEDPFEDKGDKNDTFAWTRIDYLAMPYSIGRWAINGIAWPVSAVVTPPGTAMVSDGVIGKHHDAARGTSPDPSGTTTDFTWPAQQGSPAETGAAVQQTASLH